MMSWILRFIYNLRNPTLKRQSSLEAKEIEEAESFIFRLIQQECFSDENDQRLKTLNPFKDEDGLIRLRTQFSRREDLRDFRFPVVLPEKHPVVSRLIFNLHVNSCHVGTQGLLSLLREKYWILGGRRAIRSVVSKCVICNRYRTKHFVMDSPPLPLDRVREAVAFEVTGVDFAGPLYLKDGEKVWVCLFTCAVYRAVHLELSTSLSAHSFIQALRRFVARRGRPKTIYSDNATNFVGTENAFNHLDWETISNYSSIERINWHFNPPAAPWWGGFWERLVGVLKQLLRKVLGRASLSYEDLLTTICDCEAIVNSRPLTYMSNDPTELVALTPAMFLRDQPECAVPDCDAVDETSLNRKLIHKQKLKTVLRRRFRNEYLGQLRCFNNRKQTRQVVLGEIVLVGNDNQKRTDWPLGRVTELIAGRDKKIRLVRVTTARGSLMRPIQKIYPLEYIDDSKVDECTSTDRVTGRVSSQADEKSSSSTSSTPVVNEISENSDSAGVSDVNFDIKSRVPVNNVKFSRSGRQIKAPESF